MVNLYAEYLKMPKSLDFETMEQLHQMIADEVTGDEDALELYQELLESAAKYAAIRAAWPRMSREEKMDKDSLRTSCHDSLIIHFNMLVRFLQMQGKPAKWREMLGDEKEDPYCRKSIGDFGCFLIFVESICAR